MSRPDIRDLIQEGLSLLDQRLWEKAVETFVRAEELQPDHPVPYFFCSLAFLATHRFDDARLQVEQGAERSPGNALGENVLALLDFKSGKITEAVERLRKNGIVEHPRMQSFLLLEIEKLLDSSASQ